MLERNVMSTTKSLDTLSPATATTAPDKLHRSLSVWNSLTIGFAVVSPVVGLYAIIGVQTAVTGGGWFAALAICLVMQLLVATVYAELTSQFPIAGGLTSGRDNSEGASPDNSPESSTSVPRSPC